MEPIKIVVESTCTGAEEIEILPSPSQGEGSVGESNEAGKVPDSLAWAAAFHPGIGALALLGQVVLGGVQISANPNALYFGKVNLFSSTSRSFHLNNNGDCRARVNLSSPYGYSVNPSATTINAGQSSSISVTFSPSNEQYYSGYVSGNHGISVYVQGQGVDPYK